jgi:hypothetical protein
MHPAIAGQESPCQRRFYRSPILLAVIISGVGEMVDAEDTVTVALTVEYMVTVVVTVEGHQRPMEVVMGKGASVTAMVLGDAASVASVDVAVIAVPSHVQKRW